MQMKYNSFTMTVLNSMADLEEELNRFIPHWTTYINGELTPHFLIQLI